MDITPKLPASSSGPGGAARDRRENPWSWALTSTACLVWLFIVAVLTRGIGFIPSSMGPDEGLYILQAREWLRGNWPYVAVWDMHPIGTPLIIAAGMLLFGESIASVRFIGVLFVTSTAFLLFRLATLASYSRLIGLAAGALYVSYTVLPEGLTTNTELLMAPFVTGGFVLAFVGARGVLAEARLPGLQLLAAMGLCFGAGLLVKQVAVPEACIAFLALTAVTARVLGLSPLRMAGRALVFAVACALPMTVAAFIYLTRGDFEAFVQGNFVAPLLYAAHTEDLDILVAGRLILAATFQLAWLFLAAAVPAVSLSMQRKWRSASALLPAGLFLWLIASTFGIFMPGKFYAHYFLLWIPALSLIAAIGIGEAVAWAAPRRKGVALFTLAVIFSSMPTLNNLADLAHRGFGLRRLDPPRVVAEAIAQAVPPGETAFIVNYEPIVYFLAGLPLPTRMPFWLHLAGNYGNAIGQESDAELTRVLSSKPYLLAISQAHWPEVRVGAQQLIVELLNRDYELADTVQVSDGKIEFWRRR